MLLAKRRLLENSVPGWVRQMLPGVVPSFAFDCQYGGRVWAPGQNGLLVPQCLTNARNTPELVQWSDGHWSSFPANTVAITDLGMWSWDGRTNSIFNNSMTGGVAPSTPPTHWSSSGLSVTNTYAYGVEKGLPYVDWTASGAIGDPNGGSLRFDISNYIAATNVQTWTLSAPIRLMNGSLSNLANVTLNILQRDSGGTFLALLNGSDLKGTIGSTFTRYSATLTTNQATIAFVQPAIFYSAPNGTVINFTLRIYSPQLELGGFATPIIMTTNGAVARATDVIQCTNQCLAAALAAKSAWFKTYGVAGGNSPRLLTTSANPNLSYFNSTTSVAVSDSGGLSITQASLGSGTYSGVVKTAIGLDSGAGYVIANNGAKSSTNNLNGLSGSYYLGNRPAGDRALDGAIQGFAFSNAKGAFDDRTAL